MPVRSLKQTSFFDPEFAMPGCLAPGTVPWLLARHGSLLFPDWLLAGWRDSDIGRDGWPARVLVKMLLLRWLEEGMSRRCSERRAKTDVVWRAAMGIALDKAAPSERTVRDFERFLQAQHVEAGVQRALLLHEHIVRLCRGAGVVGAGAVWAADSTPMWCYGAVRGTVRLLGDGLRSLGKMWPRSTKQKLSVVAADWHLPLLLGKSAKGSMQVDWRDSDARAGATDSLARDVLRVVDLLRTDIASARSRDRGRILQLCRSLVRVVRDDLSEDDGGRLVVARRVARDRLVSITDPQARHGRKSKKRTFKGFKLHVVGDVVSGLIASLTVTSGNVHDGAPASRLFGRAKALFADIEKMLGDTAYGGAPLRDRARYEHSIEVVAPAPPVPAPKNDRLRKADFDIDFDTWTVTCPAGATTTTHSWAKTREGKARLFSFAVDDCDNCELRARCLTGSHRKRRLLLHVSEQTVREARTAWLSPDVRRLYRERSKCERLVHSVTRHGGRQARA